MKKILLIISALIILIGIPVTVYLAQRQQELRSRAAPATTLSFSPSTLNKAPGDVFSLDVTIDTGLNQIVVAEIHLTFDDTKLEAQTITNSPLFPSILTQGVIDKGAASITVGAPNSKQPIQGKGTVAVVKFKALASTDVTTSVPTTITFSPATYITSIVEGSTNVLIGTTPANITITGGNNVIPFTPTLTPTPTSKATTPTGTPHLTPSPTSTVSAQTKQISISPFPKDTTASTQPTFTGKASPGASVTLTIYSTPLTVVVTANSSGSWSYIPKTPLDPGSHSIVASATSTSGQVETVSYAFAITSPASTATQSAIPISGSVANTYLFIIIGFCLLMIGLFYPAITS